MSKHQSLNIPASIIISGVEPEAYWDIVVNKCGRKFVLMSYHYLQNKPKDFLANRIKKNPDVKVFLDSGAHTFFSKIDEYMQKPMSFWDKYLGEYTSYIRENKDYLFACADLDIDPIVGEEIVDKWRDEIFEKLREETGVDVCYIWHDNRGEQGWEEMCRKYNYIGMSMENDKDVTVQRLMRRLKVAEKYNTRVHGMALTKTEILVRVPFFSADSTTWLVGQQYGELNWFNGRKMQRLKKDQWRRQYKTRLIKEPFNADWERVTTGMGGQGDTYELLRLNVIAYQLAEEHIRVRLKNKMYWLPKNGEVVSADSIEVPHLDWFTGECSDWKGYLEKLRISPSNYNKEEAVNILYFFYIFLNNAEDILDEEFEQEDIIDYVKVAVDSSIDNYEDALEALRDYFIGNATGERNELRGEDDMIVENNRPKERDKYVEEDVFDVIDLSEDEINTGLMLKSPDMPEVEDYDNELARNNIVAVRDEQGRFLKGQKQVRKPKNLYSQKYPKLNCDTCYKSGDCPEYNPGYVCAFDKMFRRFDTRNSDDVIDAMSSMVNHNLERLQRAMIFESLDGGMATMEVTGLIDQNARLLEKLQQMQKHNAQTILQQRRVINSDGTETVDTSMAVNPQTGGILSQIFGRKEKDNKKDDMEVIEVDYDVTEE